MQDKKHKDLEDEFLEDIRGKMDKYFPPIRRKSDSLEEAMERALWGEPEKDEPIKNEPEWI